MVYIYLLLVVIFISTILVVIFKINELIGVEKKENELTPSVAVKKRIVNEHKLINHAKEHNNKDRTIMYTFFIKKSSCMIEKINSMKENETRYYG